MRIRIDRRRWWFAIANCVLALLCAGMIAAFCVVAGTLDSIHTAERWRGENEMHFTQLAVFLPEDGACGTEQIYSFRQTLDQAMIDASLEAPEGASLYEDAYCARGSLSIAGDHGTASVSAIGVGGDFFQFHLLPLRSGSYISERDLMQDRVVLDEQTAWQIFGGSDVAGLTVTISGKPFYVAGVVSREKDFASKAAYLDGAGIFLHYSVLNELTEAEITCYEIVLPDMVSGFGLNLVQEKFPIGKGDVVENTTRYSLKHLLQVAGDFGKRSMRNNGVIYPYWENAVRYTEDYLVLLLILAVLFGVCPLVTIVVLVIRWIIRGWRWLRAFVPEKISSAVEKKKEKKYAKVGE